MRLVSCLSIAIFASICAIPLTAKGQSNSPAEPPNVLLITIDTLRADHLGTYGYPRKTSPAIDSLAKRGVQFERTMCNWPKTTPSVVSFLTGTYGTTNGVRGGCQQPMPTDLLSIAEVFEQAGYATAAVSNNPNLSINYQFNQGFEEFFEIWEEDPSNCETVTSKALEWIEATSTKPFFLWVHYLTPHTLYTPKTPYDEEFVDDGLHEEPDRILPIFNGTYFGGLNRKLTYLAPHTNLHHYISQYDGEIAWVDEEVGRLLKNLDFLGLSSDTLVVLTSDHGEELGEHAYYFEHGTQVYQTTMHVPLILSFPDRIPAGKTISHYTTLLDLFPTLLDYAGIDIPESAEGESLSGLIEGAHTKTVPVFAEGGYRNRETGRYSTVVWNDNWKLIHVSDGTYRLFNLERDPDEQTDILLENKGAARRLIRLLDRFEKRLGIKKKKPNNRMNSDNSNKPVSELSERTRAQLEALGYLKPEPED